MKRSTCIPLVGIAAVWLFYACFVLVRTPPEEKAQPKTAANGAASRPNSAAPVSPRSVTSLGSHLEEAAREESAATPAEPARETPAAGDEEGRIGAEDREFLAALAACTGESDLVPLERFVAEHPEHALARASLVLKLFAQDAEDAAIRPHVDALQALMPEFGLPDLLAASLERRAGNVDRAQELLLAAADKNMSWFPNSEILRLKLKEEMGKGTSTMDALASAFNTNMGGLVVARQMTHDFLSGEWHPDREVRAETARSLFKFGAAMQERGLSLIENLVGYSIASKSAEGMQASGSLGAEEQALLKRGAALLGESRVTGAMTMELIADPVASKHYLENLAVHGELRAARRSLMDYLARGTRWR